jgi:hypothetical protein
MNALNRISERIDQLGKMQDDPREFNKEVISAKIDAFIECAKWIASDGDLADVVVSSSNVCTDTGEECKYNCSGLCKERC